MFTQEDTVQHNQEFLGKRTEHLMTSGKGRGGFKARGYFESFFVFDASESSCFETDFTVFISEILKTSVMFV